jgi:hypothetical protein
LTLLGPRFETGATTASGASASSIRAAVSALQAETQVDLAAKVMRMAKIGRAFAPSFSPDGRAHCVRL